MSAALWSRVQADAFNLPLPSCSIDVIIADPPYEPSTPKRDPRGKRGHGFDAYGYVRYSGREWLAEAERVLKPDGHLYLVIPVRELGAWLDLRPDFKGNNTLDSVSLQKDNGLAGGCDPCARPLKQGPLE